MTTTNTPADLDLQYATLNIGNNFNEYDRVKVVQDQLASGTSYAVLAMERNTQRTLDVGAFKSEARATEYAKQVSHEYGWTYVEGVEQAGVKAGSAGSLDPGTRAALLFALLYHQGSTSTIGQPLRKLLGMAPEGYLTEKEIDESDLFKNCLKGAGPINALESCAGRPPSVSHNVTLALMFALADNRFQSDKALSAPINDILARGHTNLSPSELAVTNQLDAVMDELAPKILIQEPVDQEAELKKDAARFSYLCECDNEGALSFISENLGNRVELSKLIDALIQERDEAVISYPAPRG